MAQEPQSAGIKPSKLLVTASDPHDPRTVWVIDYYRLPSKPNYKCSYLLGRVRESFTKRGTSSKGWQLFLYDLKDTGSPDIQDCIERLALLLQEGGPDFTIKYASRHVEAKRDFGCLSMVIPTCRPTENQSFRELYGRPWNYTSKKFTKFIQNGVIAKYHHTVRPDIAKAIRDRHVNPITTIRKGDVAHFWKINPEPWAHTDLRNRVSEALLSLHERHANLTVTADFVGAHSSEGRTTVGQAYVDALLDYKIVVVAQRDTWEDHLRLFEGLVSGALVLTDPWVHLPYGYKDGVNIVVYWSIADLKKKIMYYLNHDDERLRIARAGRKLALEQHMPWHRMERFLLGKWPESYEFPLIPFLNSSANGVDLAYR